MKKNFWFLIIAIVALISVPSCVKQELVPENENIPVVIIGAPLDDGLIAIKATNPGENVLKSGTLASDTFNTEKFLPVTYQVINKTGMIIASYQWTFAENNQKVNGPTVVFWHSLDPGSKTLVTVIGVEPNGTAHIATIWAKIVYSLDGMPGFILVSKTAVVGGSFSYIFAAHKKGMQGVKGNYGFVGNITNPTWIVNSITPLDTNFNYINNVLVAASAGDVGKYVAIRVVLYPGEYEIHVGHISNTGTLNWGNFWSFYKDGKFTVTPNGDLSGLSIVGLPGASGDEGVNAVVRKDILNSSVIVYTKHTAPFSKGFIQLQYANGTWQSPIAETAVTGYPNWGKVEILYSSFPTPEILVFRFGSNIDTPNIFSANMPFSGYWTPLQVLEMKVVRLGN